MIIDKNFDLKFKKLISHSKEWLIIPHYNPDPDAIASAFAMQFLLDKIFDVKTYIYFSGIIGRAENKKMIDILEIPVISLKENENLPNLPVILIDTQPGAGNNPLKSIKKLKIIIDHHLLNEHSLKIPYADIRMDFGSSSSIVYDYFNIFDLKPSVNIATALYYGIQSDVVGEGRTAFKIDFDHMEHLSDLINKEKLYLIENPKLPFDYYIHINKGMENSVIYDDFLITNLGRSGKSGLYR